MKTKKSTHNYDLERFSNKNINNGLFKHQGNALYIYQWNAFRKTYTLTHKRSKSRKHEAYKMEKQQIMALSLFCLIRPF